MSKAKDTTSRVTVYRLIEQLDLKKVAVDDYEKAGNGTDKSTGFQYSLWFGVFNARPPSWFPPFEDIADKTPTTKPSGFVLLVNTSNATYGCTGGLVFHCSSIVG